LPADGRIIPINQYQALFALLGFTYGGDNVSNFGLPDLRGRVVVGSGSAPGLTPVQFSKTSGAESVTLVANNLPAHTHPASVTGGTVSGTVSLPLSGASVTGQTISGSVTVNALNGDNPPSGGVNIPTGTANTVGKTGSALNFYPPGTNKVAVPTTHDLAVSGGTVTGNASGTVNLPIASATLAVGPNVTANAPVATIPARLGQTVCIATVGIWPSRD
jgi:microcystin-dependent protein